MTFSTECYILTGTLLISALASWLIRSQIGVIWFLFFSTICSWLYGLGGMSGSQEQRIAELFLKWPHYIFGAIWIPPIFFHLSLTVNGNKKSVFKYPFYLASFIFSFTCYSGKFAWAQFNQGLKCYYTVPTNNPYIYIFFVLFFSTCVLMGFWNLWQKSKNVKISPLYLKLLILFLFLGFAGGGTAFLPVFNINFRPQVWTLGIFSLGIFFIVWKVYDEYLKAKIAEALEKVDYMTKIICHDLKNKIIVPSMSLQRLIFQAGNNDVLLQIQYQLNIVSNSIANLINVTENEAAGIKIKPEKINTEILRNKFENFKKICFFRNIVCEIELTEDAVIVDWHYFELVIDNLLQNIFQSTPEGGKVRIKQKYNEIIFSNSGFIIPENNRSGIFEKYENRGSHTAYNKGLGLHYSKMIVELHGGKIAYRANDIEKMNEFVIKFPGTKKGF